MRTAAILGALVGLCFAGCGSTTPISSNPIQDVRAAPKPLIVDYVAKVVVQGLLDATFNLDSAVTVGALEATDPAPPCFHGFLQKLGLDPTSQATPNPSFVPRVSDLVSEGSVLYIRARQAQRLQATGIQVAPGCKELIADFMLDAASAGVKGLPGGGFFPLLK